MQDNSGMMPNEYTIQLASGVYSALTLLPYYSIYVPNAKQTKLGLQYNFLGRTTLKYSANCDYPIYDAYNVLESMNGAWGDSLENVNMAILIMASCYFGIQFIWMICATCCFMKKRDKPVHEFNGIFMNSIFLVFALSVLICSSIVLGGFNSRVYPLKEWHDYADCVDEYMQINDYQVTQLDDNSSRACTMVVLSSGILLIHIFSLIQSLKSSGCCKNCKCCPCCH